MLSWHMHTYAIMYVYYHTCVLMHFCILIVVIGHMYICMYVIRSMYVCEYAKHAYDVSQDVGYYRMFSSLKRPTRLLALKFFPSFHERHQSACVHTRTHISYMHIYTLMSQYDTF